MDKVKERIISLLNKKNISKAELQKLSGLKKSTFYNVFDDKTNSDNLCLKTLKALSNVLNVSIDYLVYGNKKTCLYLTYGNNIDNKSNMELNYIPKISQRIRILRQKYNINIDDLANKIGKNRATIYRYENGDIENLPISVLIPFAEALHTTPEYLIGYEDRNIRKIDYETDKVNTLVLYGRNSIKNEIKLTDKQFELINELINTIK